MLGNEGITGNAETIVGPHREFRNLSDTEPDYVKSGPRGTKKVGGVSSIAINFVFLHKNIFESMKGRGGSPLLTIYAIKEYYGYNNGEIMGRGGCMA